MSHINFEDLYHLVELAEEELPFNNDELSKMQHISQCRECYDKYCGLMSLADVTSESGYIVLSEMYGAKKEVNVVNYLSDKIMSVIDVTVQKVKDSVSVIMKQVDQIQAGISFEPSLAVATRDGFNSKEVSIQKLENIENERTFVAYDVVSNVLLVQIDTRDVNANKMFIRINLENGDDIEVPLTKVGTLLKGKLENVPGKTFRIIIEQM